MHALITTAAQHAFNAPQQCVCVHTHPRAHAHSFAHTPTAHNQVSLLSNASGAAAGGNVLNLATVSEALSAATTVAPVLAAMSNSISSGNMTSFATSVSKLLAAL